MNAPSASCSRLSGTLLHGMYVAPSSTSHKSLNSDCFTPTSSAHATYINTVRSCINTFHMFYVHIKYINIRDLQIGNFCSNRIGGYDSNSNQGVVVYVFYADYKRTEMCGFSWFLKQYCTIAPTVLASVYALAT